MADRFPLILNTSANQIQEIASGDTLDLTDVNISNAGVITATSFAGDGSGLIGVASTDNIVTGTAATFNNTVDINADLDVDGHTNLDNLSVAGVSTFAGITTVTGDDLFAKRINVSGVCTAQRFVVYGPTPRIYLTDTNNNDDFQVRNENGTFEVRNDTDDYTPFSIASNNTVTVHNDLDVDGHTNLDNVSVAGVTTFTGDTTFSANVSIGGTLTYEDVTNIDSVGIITARSDIKVGTGVTITPAGAGFFSGIVTATSLSIDDYIYHNGDPNTFFGFESNDTIRFNTNGSDKLKINSSGYLILADDNDTYIHHPASDTIAVTVGSNERLRVNSSGITVTGTVDATSFVGDGSNLTGVGISTEQVTPSSNVATLDLTKNEHKIVASGTYTIDISGGTESESHVIRIENSGISTVGFSTYFKFPSGGTPALPTASGAISLISFTVHKVGSVGIATVLLAGASVNFS